MVVLMFGLSFAVAYAEQRLVAGLKAQVHQVKRWGGAILLFVGGWLILLSLFADYFAELFPV